MDLDTTIIALSSPSGRAHRALIRASGLLAFAGAEAIGLHPRPHQLCADQLTLDSMTLPVLCGAFPAGSSYTGQDTVEIQLPSNPFLVQRVINSLVRVTEGRLAIAGEFTARAFFHGRISLSEAEGVCATISATNDAELLGASFLRKGALSSIVQSLADELIQTLSRIEAEIDFAEEEDIVVISEESRLRSIKQCISTIDATLAGCIPMATLRQLQHVVLAGAPNAGKSTLYNALLGERRVVVSSVAGTTRDAIAEPVFLHGKEAMLLDIAGIEISTNQLLAVSQQAASRAIASAELVLWCVAPTTNPTPPPTLTNVLVVHTKKDLAGSHPDAICAHSGVGMEELRSRIATKLEATPTPREDALAILPRHEQALTDALMHLNEALHNISQPELTASSLRLALDAVGLILGHVTPDEVLGEVFATFCIGK